MNSALLALPVDKMNWQSTRQTAGLRCYQVVTMEGRQENGWFTWEMAPVTCTLHVDLRALGNHAGKNSVKSFITNAEQREHTWPSNSVMGTCKTNYTV
jgi:hypothetical protein